MIEARNWYEVGCSDLKNKQYDMGLLAFAKASALVPDSPLIRTGIALAFFELGDRTTAVALAQALVHSSPGDASAWLLLGDIARRSCLWEQALAAATRAFELDPDNYNIMFLYAVLLGEFGRLGEQRELFERLVARYPKNLNPHCYLGKAQLRDGDYAAGWRHFETRFFIDKQYGEFWLS
jgi:cytochrome c-type biogenesis protein CcmH/NrfG